MININSIQFLETFGAEYSRNNRKSGQKSLRCFPLCQLHGHSDSGFCGRAVTVCVEISGNLMNAEDNFVFGGELHRSGASDSSIHGLVEDQRINQYADLRNNPEFKGWIGVIDQSIYNAERDTTYITVNFNKGRHSWDYEWKSNRWTGSETKHVFSVFIFQQFKGSASLYLSKIASSTEFIVSCSHKTSSTNKTHSMNQTNNDNTEQIVRKVKNKLLRKSDTPTMIKFLYDENISGEGSSGEDSNDLYESFGSKTSRFSRKRNSSESSKDSLSTLASLSSASSDGNGRYTKQIKFDNDSSSRDTCISDDETIMFVRDDKESYLERLSDERFAKLMSLVNQSCYLFDIQHRVNLSQQSNIL